VIVEGISSEELLYRETESYMSHHKTSKHQCTHLGSVPQIWKWKCFNPFGQGAGIRFL